MHLAIQTPLCALPCRPWKYSVCKQHAPARFSHVVQASGSRSKVAESKGSDGKVENLSTSYCDDFQCTSSPAVGNTIKSFAKDIERGKSWTLQLFAERVVYKGGARSFTGKSKYQRLYWARDNLTNYKTQVISMEMVGQDTADVKWKFSGQLGPLPLKGSVTSTLVQNPLTGQIVQHTDNYSFSESEPVARMAASAQRLAWASKQNAKDTKETLDSALDSLSSIDESDVYNPDPTNPNKFFQQRDNTFQDAVLYATFLAILWGLWQAYTQLYSM